jgi:hypothetical protein
LPLTTMTFQFKLALCESRHRLLVIADASILTFEMAKLF